jgi:hypothetical protein
LILNQRIFGISSEFFKIENVKENRIYQKSNFQISVSIVIDVLDKEKESDQF